MNNEKKPRPDKEAAGEIKVQNGFVRWLDNVWYHYKFQIVAVVFFLIVIAICTVQCATREGGDMTVTYGGEHDLSAPEREAFLQVLGLFAPTKENTDSPMSLLLSQHLLYDEETLRSRFFDEEGRFDNMGFQTAKGFNADRIQNFGTFIMTGESPLLFVSPYIYGYQNMERLAVPVSQHFPNGTAGVTQNGYAIRLGDTDFYKYYKAVQVLPADTLIVLSHEYVWGASSDNELYEAYVEMYKKIVEFKMP